MFVCVSVFLPVSLCFYMYVNRLQPTEFGVGIWLHWSPMKMAQFGGGGLEKSVGLWPLEVKVQNHKMAYHAYARTIRTLLVTYRIFSYQHQRQRELHFAMQWNVMQMYWNQVKQLSSVVSIESYSWPKFTKMITARDYRASDIQPAVIMFPLPMWFK